MMPEKNSNIRPTLQESAALVRAWGRSTPLDDRSLEDILTIEGISLWSVISPMLALGLVQSQLTHQSSIKHFGLALTQRAKRLAFDAAIPIVANKNGCKNWGGLPVFLFLGFSHYMYREIMQPVAERLASRTDCSVVVLDDVFSIRHVQASRGGVKFQSLWQHWDTDVRRTERTMRNKLKNTIEQLTAPSALTSIVGPSNLSQKELERLFKWLFEKILPRAVTQSAIAIHIMKRHRPALLISPDVHDPRTRIFCHAGQLSGIKTLEMQFGLNGMNNVEWQFFSAAHLAVTGEAHKQVMIAHGITAEKMSITGSPRYDRALARSQDLVKVIRDNLKIPDSKLVVLFASQPYIHGVFGSPKIRFDMMSALFLEISKLDDIILVVKPHPLEEIEEIENLAMGAANIIFADKLTDIRDLISVADVFVTYFSVTTFYALALNKLTINLAFPGTNANVLFEECGATLIARSADDIARILYSISSGRITELLNNLASAKDHFLQQWLYQLDGLAGERVAELALKIAFSEQTREPSEERIDSRSVVPERIFVKT